MGALELTPIRLKDAQAFVAKHHRHNIPSIQSVFNIGISLDGELVGVAMVGIPKARLMMDGYTLEVTRTCVVEGTKNANSKLYGACSRAAQALGYKRLITYTLPEESGASLKAAGWTLETDNAGGDDWTRRTLHPGKGSHTVADLWGEVTQRIPQGKKLRWVRHL